MFECLNKHLLLVFFFQILADFCVQHYKLDDEYVKIYIRIIVQLNHLWNTKEIKMKLKMPPLYIYLVGLLTYC